LVFLFGSKTSISLQRSGCSIYSSSWAVSVGRASMERRKSIRTSASKVMW
ncbi:hypothetical protein CFP56_028320, partial [Quercus suber]